MIERHAVPGEWRWTTLGEVGRWSSGGTPKSGVARYYGGPHLWAGIGDLTDGVIDTTDRTITDAGLVESSAKLVPPGALLVAMYGGGSIGKLGITRFPMATNQAIACCQPHDDVATKWLFYWLMLCRPDLIRAGKGGAQDNISQTILKGWPVPIPPIAEQQAIVDVVDSMLSRLLAAHAGVGSCAERAFHGERAVVEACLRGDLGGDVSSWEVRSLGELATTVRNGGHWKAPEAQPPGVPILRIGAVRPMRLNAGERGYIRATVAEDELDKFTVRDGSLLFTRYNGNPRLVGACALAGNSAAGMLHPDKLIRVDLEDYVLPAWVELAAAGGMTRRHIDRHVKTTAGQAGIAGRDIKTAPVPLPDPETQRVLAARVNAIVTKLRHLGGQLAASDGRAAALRRGILSAAFHGRLSAGGAGAPSLDDIQEVVA